MGNSFEEAYANYLKSLAKLDDIEDIAEKNALFRQLTEQLSRLEHTLKESGTLTGEERGEWEDPDLPY